MPDERITLSELEVSSGSDDKRLYLQTRLKNEGKEGFLLTLLDGENVWEGNISEDDLDRQSGDLKMDFNTYVRETRAAFTREDMKDLNFECHFKSTSANSGQLVWKKMPTHDIKYNLGSVSLKKSAKTAAKICDVLSHCITNSRMLQAQIQSSETDNERLSLERQNALKRLDKCVTAKEELEKDLYSKFVLVLNSKKEKIRALQENQGSESLDDSPVPSTSRTDNTSQGPTRNAASKNGVASKHKVDSASDDYQVDTDEESSVPPKKTQKSKRPSKISKADSSLNLGEDEDEDEGKSAVVARRPRRQAAAKKQTPAKPVLPRVSSGNTPSERPGSAGRKSSMRKSNSNNSNKSSDNIDPDDLLDNF